MARRARAVAVGCWHHVTQRGNGRQAVFVAPDLCEAYLELLAFHARRLDLRVLAYCLMTNHVHLVVVPEQERSMANTFRHAHARFSQAWNTLAGRDGHLWQNRYYSCPVSDVGWAAVARYVERNPVRAGMVERAEEFRWSSAAVHVGLAEDPHGLLEVEGWRWGFEEWAEILRGVEVEDELAGLRRATYTGRPWGDRDWVAELESKLGRRLGAAMGGRPKRVVEDGQMGLWE